MLAATVNKISHPLMHLLRRSYETGDPKNVRSWRDSFGLECESEIKASVKVVLADTFGLRPVAA